MSSAGAQPRSAPTLTPPPPARDGDEPAGRHRHTTVGHTSGEYTIGAQTTATAPGSPAYQTELDRLRAQRDRLQAEHATLRWVADHDELTGLPNRRMFRSAAPALLARPGHESVLAVLDLNGFKPINDRYGHDTGDAVLRLIARRLTHHATDELVARLGGDEFAILLSGPHDGDDPWWQPRITAICAAIRTPMYAAGRVVTVTTSVGIALADGHAGVDELLRRADQAMYQAKGHGRCAARWEATHADAGPADPTRVPEPDAVSSRRRTPPPPAVELLLSRRDDPYRPCRRRR